MNMRLSFSKKYAVSTLLIASAAAIASGPLLAQEAIKIGVLEDQSGDFAAATMVKVHAIELAADEINCWPGCDFSSIESSLPSLQGESCR